MFDWLRRMFRTERQPEEAPVRQEAKQREQFEVWDETRDGIVQQRKDVDRILRRRLRLNDEEASYRRPTR